MRLIIAGSMVQIHPGAPNILAMNVSEMILVVLGLTLFEVISSIDNAVVNADVLATMSRPARRWFLF